MLVTFSAPAQNLFVSGLEGSILELTPGGVQSTFASGLYDYTTGLAFNSAGDLFVSAELTGNITEITPGGVESTTATGLNGADGLAFQGVTLPVPEPSALGLLAVGAAAFFVRRRHRI